MSARAWTRRATKWTPKRQAKAERRTARRRAGYAPGTPYGAPAVAR